MSDLATTRRIKRGWMNLRVHEIFEETHDTKTFIFQDAEEGGRPYDFVAGQYLTFRYDTVAEKIKAAGGKNDLLIEKSGGWIRNHSMYRGQVDKTLIFQYDRK